MMMSSQRIILCFLAPLTLTACDPTQRKLVNEAHYFYMNPPSTNGATIGDIYAFPDSYVPAVTMVESLVCHSDTPVEGAVSGIGEDLAIASRIEGGSTINVTADLNAAIAATATAAQSVGGNVEWVKQLALPQTSLKLAAEGKSLRSASLKATNVRVVRLSEADALRRRAYLLTNNFCAEAVRQHPRYYVATSILSADTDYSLAFSTTGNVQVDVDIEKIAKATLTTAGAITNTRTARGTDVVLGYRLSNPDSLNSWVDPTRIMAENARSFWRRTSAGVVAGLAEIE